MSAVQTKHSLFGTKLNELATSDSIALEVLVYSDCGMLYDGDPNKEIPVTERTPAILMEPYLNSGRI